MNIIKRLPKFCKDFFQKIRRFFEKDSCSFNHTARAIIAIAGLNGRVSLSKMAELFGNKRTRQAIQDFLSGSKQNLNVLLRKQALYLLKKLGWKPGEPLYYAIDDTQIQKFGKEMEGLSKIWLHAEKKYAWGHTVFLGTLIYRNIAIPYDLQVWVSSKTCEKTYENGKARPFVKLTELAAESIRSINLPKSTRITVLCDRYYLCKPILDSIKSKGFNYVAAVKSNRLFSNERRQYKVGLYANQCLKTNGKWLSLGSETMQYRVAERVGRINKVGEVKVVFSRRRGDKQGLILATNREELKAKEIIQIYRNRWTIEILFKMAKQYLGMGDYQFLKLRSVESYLRLVMCAHLYLTHLAIDEQDAQEIVKTNKPICLAGIGRIQETLRNKLFIDMVDSWRKNTTKTQIFNKLRVLYSGRL